MRRREVGALSSKMLLQIAVTKIHGIYERFALIIKYLGNVTDGHMDLAVVQTQLTRHRGFLLPYAKGVGAGDRWRRATTYGHYSFLLPSAKGVGTYGHCGFLLLSTKGVSVGAGDRNVSTSNGAAAARKVLNVRANATGHKLIDFMNNFQKTCN